MRWVSIEVQGEEKLKVALTNMADAIDDLRPYWNEVQQEFYRIEKQAFASEGTSGESGKWSALSPRYAVVKFKRWGAVPILTASGTLRDSLTSETSGSIVRKEKDELTVGSSVPYGRYHQSGTSKMPARPPISLTENNRADLLRKLTKQLKAVKDRNNL